MNVSTTERLVKRLRKKVRVDDRRRSGRLRFTSQCHSLSSRSTRTVKYQVCEAVIQERWPPDSSTSYASYGENDGSTCLKISDEAVETDVFTDMSRYTLFHSDDRRHVNRRRGEHDVAAVSGLDLHCLLQLVSLSEYLECIRYFKQQGIEYLGRIHTFLIRTLKRVWWVSFFV